MVIGLVPKLALATVAAVGLYIPTLGLPLPSSCLRTIGVAGAAPSPSCGGDLRECLRASADMHPTTFGVRYVTADDVARCMEAFRSCISGGASGGGQSPPTPTAAEGGNRKGLPQRFTITTSAGFMHDCRVSGDTVSCEISYQQPVEHGMTTYRGTVSGRLSGSTMTGRWETQSRSDGAEGCVSEGKESGPATYVFNPDGTVAMRVGPQQADFVYTGSCSDAPPYSSTLPVWEETGTWSPSE